MSAATLLVILVVGLIAGWLAGQVVKGTGFGLVADIAIGIVGALIGSWLLPRLGIHLDTWCSSNSGIDDSCHSSDDQRRAFTDPSSATSKGSASQSRAKSAVAI
jgi:uncharacterized membrane protein YeaQ/YmgE (transglycosylase-associated protein family)